MKATIYIRKENKDWWREKGSSAWVNEQIQDQVSFRETPTSNPTNTPTAVKKGLLCEHFKLPGQCKYPGCKNV